MDLWTDLETELFKNVQCLSFSCPFIFNDLITLDPPLQSANYYDFFEFIPVGTSSRLISTGFNIIFG
jgi:hypothetical protein